MTDYNKLLKVKFNITDIHKLSEKEIFEKINDIVDISYNYDIFSCIKGNMKLNPYDLSKILSNRIVLLKFIKNFDKTDFFIRLYKSLYNHVESKYNSHELADISYQYYEFLESNVDQFMLTKMYDYEGYNQEFSYNTFNNLIIFSHADIFEDSFMEMIEYLYMDNLSLLKEHIGWIKNNNIPELAKTIVTKDYTHCNSILEQMKEYLDSK